MKLSKTSWMILCAGVFIIILAGLGLARSSQMQEYNQLEEDLRTTQVRVDNLQTAQYQTQIDELGQQLSDANSQVAEAKDKLRQIIVSVDVTDKFYEIADYYDVSISTMGTSAVLQQPFESISCEMISLNAAVTGTLDNVIGFITGLNNNYTTGYVKSVQVSIEGEGASATVQMIVYSYKGS